MAVYYVSTSGNNNNNGGSNSPWRTISHAVQSNLQPGDEIVVRSGTYSESITINRGGSEAGDVTLRSEVPGGAKIRPPSGSWNAISVSDDYVTVEGFDIGGARGDGIEANNVHHVSILNNTVHGSGESGIQFNWSEFITIDGNVTYDNAWSGWFSGISVYQSRNITGDTSTPGFRTIVRNNVSYDNVTDRGAHTDGNGIIIDDFRSTQTSGYSNYDFPTLVENNLVYQNGGKGIQVFLTDNVTVRNNTSWHNNVDLQNPGTYRAEISNQAGDNNEYYNNIAVADPSVNRNNTAIGDYGGYNDDTTWFNNLTFNGTAGSPSTAVYDGNEAIRAADGNLLGVNPGFVNAQSGNFQLGSNSQAVNAGTQKFGLPRDDLDGGARAVGTVDIGAYERDSGGTPTPPPAPTPTPTPNRSPDANDDQGFSTQSGGTIRIAEANLTANDSDPDGDALDVASVGNAVGGNVRLTSADEIVFEAGANFVGAASFRYTASDGKGGTSTADVMVDVVANQENSAPAFTSSSLPMVNEGQRLAIKLTANDADNDSLTFSKIGGIDADLFYLNSRTGELSFVKIPDYEAPHDSNRNNYYNVNVGVTDGVIGDPVTMKLGIRVRNVVNETAPPPEPEAPTTPPPTAAQRSTLFGSQDKPAYVETNDRQGYELGVKFSPVVDGEIHALRYYRGADDAGDTDTRTMTLWTSSGDRLASAKAVSRPGETGWQEAELSAPIDVSAGKTYLVSYGTEDFYAASSRYFDSTSDLNASGDLLLPGGSIGVYNTDLGRFPTDTWKSSNYWADVVFVPDAATGGSDYDTVL